MAIKTEEVGGLPPRRPADGALAPAAALFHSLSDPARLAILQYLAHGERRVRDLTQHLGLAQSTVSAHLACLKDCGLVDTRPEGRASMFSLRTAPELLAVLATAERLLEATGFAVELCPNYGIRRTGVPGVKTVMKDKAEDGAR